MGVTLKKIAVAAAFAAIAVSGCVSPGVRPNPLATQYRATNVIDWQSLAARTVAAIPASAGASHGSVYLPEGPRDSRFYAIYRNYLEQELYRQNYAVLRTPAGADVLLETHTNWVLHDHNGKTITDYSTFWTSAVAYFGQMRHISSLDTGFAAGIATGVIADFLDSLDGSTRAEVVVTTNIVSPRTNRLHFVRSETLYVEPSELTNYMDALPMVALPVTRASTR